MATTSTEMTNRYAGVVSGRPSSACSPLGRVEIVATYTTGWSGSDHATLFGHKLRARPPEDASP